MKKKTLLVWLIVAFLLVNFIVLSKYVFPPIIEINKTYSSTYGPEKEFRQRVTTILEKKLEVPKEYTFSFDKEVHGGEIQVTVYLMHIYWKDNRGFEYDIEIESDHSLNEIVKINPKIIKKSDYNLSFKDYIPNNYFYPEKNAFDLPENNYLKEESATLNEIRKDANYIVLGNEDLGLKYLAIPAIAILSDLPKQDFGIRETKVDAVAVIHKEGNDYIYEYDYNGDGLLDETKTYNELQDPLEIVKSLADRLNIKYTLVDKGLPKNLPGQNRKFESAFNRVELEDHTTSENTNLKTFIKYETEDGWIIEVTADGEADRTEIWIGPFIKND